ncbi:hypothetical protein ACQPW1_05375 [Nocardia sp. CA-128927]|uniref:hypothetical protein n=1 Tax=Nocardia sp. CA-128927 TaxID=3239975 RepID=UPI003D9851A0
MRIRAAVATLGIAAGLAATAASFGAGQAAAFQPVIEPQNGVYLGVTLDHSETVALRNSPLPGMVDQLWRDRGLIDIDPRSLYASDDDVIYADFSDAIDEAAAFRYGSVNIGIVDPARLYEMNLPAFQGRNLLLVQFLD